VGIHLPEKVIMKRYAGFAFIVFLLTVQGLKGQCTNTCGTDLISNGGFQASTSFCNVSDIQLYNNQSPVQSWFGTEPFVSGTAAGSTPDYFSSCAGTTNSANNVCMNGAARIGLFTRAPFSNGREYVQSQLSTPLVAGQTYCFSMVVKSKVGAAGNILSSCDGIGAWFHNQGLININTMNGGTQYIGPGSTINATPQVQNASGNMIGASCVTVTGTFCAQGGEQWIVLGNFRDDASTQMSGSANNNYMYIDDVSLYQVCSTPLNTVLTANPATVCPGACSVLSAASTGGSGVYTYLWLPGGATTSTISVCPSSTASYTLVTSSSAGCAAPLSISNTITVNVSTLSLAINTPSAICNGSSVTLTATPSDAGGTFLWSPGGEVIASVTVNPSATTTYSCSYTYGGCVANAVSTITVTPSPSVSVTSATVCAGNSGTITASGASSYSWNTGDITPGITVSPASTASYTVTGTTNGCTATAVATVTVNNCTSTSPCTNTCGADKIINGSFESSTSSCNVSDIQVYNNQSPVQSWLGTEPFVAGTTAGSTPDYFSACAGSTNSANSNCMTGAARVGLYTRTSFANGREYVQSQLASPLIAGKTYCFSMVVKSKVGAAGNILSSCDGIGAWFHNQGLIDINTMNGGTQYIGPGSSINAVPQIENAAGNMIGGSCVTVTGTFCALGGEAWVVLGNFRDDASTQMNGPNPSNYMYIDDVSLFEICSTPLQATLASSLASVCQGNCSVLTATATGGSGSYGYTWMPGGATTNTVSVCPTVTTTYTLTTSSQTACGTQETYVDSITITVNNCFNGVTAAGATICSGACASINAMATGAPSTVTYSWQPGGMTGSTVSVCPSSTTVYTVTVSDGSLSFSDACTVTVIPMPVADAGADQTICSGTVASLNGSGGGSYSWNTNPASTNSSVAVSPSTDTDYILTVSTSSCTDSDTVHVSVVQAPVVQLQHTDISCYGLNDGTGIATISGGTQPLSFSWSPGNVATTSITGLAAGSYTFSVTDAAGCAVSQIIGIMQPSALTLQIAGASAVCEGDQVTLTAQVNGGSPGYSYNWHGAGPDQPVITVNPPVSTNYSLTVTDPQGCQSVSSHLLNVNPDPQALFSGSDTLCVPFNTGFINLSSNAANYIWLFGDGAVSSFNDPVHTYTTPGNYNVSLIAESGNGCRDTFTVYQAIHAIAAPFNMISVSTTEVSEYDPTLSISFNSENAVSCAVDFGDGILVNACMGESIAHTFKDTGNYCITFTSANQIGCTYASSVCVQVLPEFTFFVPNSFTPDNDGRNDVFTGYGSNFKGFEMLIYDRWGQQIYYSNDYEKPWDGKVPGKNEPLQIDVYIYKISVQDFTDSKHVFTGQVSLIR
jgi:gliding motility-associated-like protein